jgi:hypothetical protein
LELPEVIIGYYVSNVVGGIMVSGEVREEYRAGVAYSGEQAKVIFLVAFGHSTKTFNLYF